VRSTPASNCGIWAMMLPSISVTMVMPVLVSRSSGRASSRARMRAISMCCQGPMLVKDKAAP